MLPARYQPTSKSVTPGGYGSVQKVKDTFLGRTVLFKRMHNSAHNEQLETEIRALSKVRSRHVVEIYDVIYDKHDKVEGIIIELLPGREFTHFHKNYPVDLNGYLRVLFQIATALADAHDAGVVHRDLKLDNLRETASGVLKLFDFGISSTDSTYTTKDNRGTMLYAAPELYEDGAKITPEMDVYALGVCAWALATDDLPEELYEQPPQHSSRAHSIDTVAPGRLAPEVAALIDSCLDPDPSARPTARQISIELGLHLVRGQHRGLFVQGANKIYELSHASPRVAIKIPTQGELGVQYDGLSFKIVSVSGDVYMNNSRAKAGDELHKACVLTFGSNGAGRTYVQFASSHPEVIL